MKNAKLPDQAVADMDIADMKVDYSGYAVSWAMHVDQERNCWLRPTYTVRRHPGGTVQMRVERRTDGYYVQLEKGYRYELNGNQKVDGLLPVSGFLGEDE